MNRLFNDINNRMDFGRSKYGHGVIVNDNMADYTRSKKDSFLEMQLEEILDGIIYTAAANLRWFNKKYDYDTSVLFNKDNNSDIKTIIQDTINENYKDDPISIKYHNLLTSMIKTYNDTVLLQEELERNDLYLL